MRGNPARLLRWIRSGLPIPLGAMRNRRSVLGVHNLAAAVMAVVAAQGVGGRAFFASDGEPVTIPEIVRGLARGLGRPAHLVSVPAPLLSGAARLAGALPASTFAAHAIQALTSDLVLDDSALRRATGYGPVTDTAEGLFQTGLAYRDSGPTSKWV
jgi:nucleoside-diphosphate-sugar epimerase